MLIQSHIRRLPIRANSVDLIFTDPPYYEHLLPCYQWLAAESKRVLKPQGFVVAMCGGLYLNRIFRYFEQAGLTFYWQYVLYLAGDQLDRVRPHHNAQVNVKVKAKFLLAFSKGISVPRHHTQGVIYNPAPDKRFHPWGQHPASAQYFIQHFSQPNDVVLDPFIGGGTTAVVCEHMGRRWIAGDLDPKALGATRQRLQIQQRQTTAH